MPQLLEHILNEDYVSANDLFEERMLELQERKLYEAKRNVAAMYEAKGKYGHYMGKEDWAEYRKKHPSLGMYDVPGKKPGTFKKGKPPTHEKTASGGLTSKGVEVRRKKGYLQAYPALKSLEFIKKVRKYHETGKIDEQETPFMRTLGREAEKAVTAGKEAKARKTPAPGALGVTAKAKKEKETSGVSPGMRQYLRQKYREKKGISASGLALKSLGKAISPKSSFKGRITALKRAGKSAAIAAKPVTSTISKAQDIKRSIDTKAGQFASHFGISAI